MQPASCAELRKQPDCSSHQAGMPTDSGPTCAGGIASIAATGWRVQAARDAVLLETAWGCGGHVHDVLLQGWAISNTTADVLRINARSHACEVDVRSSV
jgi:hypothetical protein